MNDESLVGQLLFWYDRNRRELPWREESDPYRIWVSEVMLQQTRVDTVIPYYQRFVQRFPDIHALAAAPEEDVLSHWQGLGYYSRARNLQLGVREVVARYGGKVPDTQAEMLSLPGVGAYTAGAVLSIAHNKPEPAVDGNVLRVFTRLNKIEEAVELAVVRQKVVADVRAMMEATSRKGDLTQALMELGALVCVPRSPRCEICPWQLACEGLRHQLQNSLPRKKSVAPPRTVQVYGGILVEGNRVLVVKRPDSGILAGMWQFPSIEVLAETEDESVLTDGLIAHFAELGQIVKRGTGWQRLSHVFSHREWKIRTFFCVASSIDRSERSNRQWLTGEDFNKTIWAGPHRKLASLLKEELG